MIAQLDTKSVYTFMESLVTIKDYVQVAKAWVITHWGIMDVDNLYGAYELIEVCQSHNITPFSWFEVELKLDNEMIPFRMLALSTKGYQNLMKISTVKMMGEEQLGGCEAPNRRTKQSLSQLLLLAETCLLI